VSVGAADQQNQGQQQGMWGSRTAPEVVADFVDTCPALKELDTPIASSSRRQGKQTVLTASRVHYH